MPTHDHPVKNFTRSSCVLSFVHTYIRIYVLNMKQNVLLHWQTVEIISSSLCYSYQTGFCWWTNPILVYWLYGCSFKMACGSCVYKKEQVQAKKKKKMKNKQINWICIIFFVSYLFVRISFIFWLLSTRVLHNKSWYSILWQMSQRFRSDDGCEEVCHRFILILCLLGVWLCTWVNTILSRFWDWIFVWYSKQWMMTFSKRFWLGVWNIL